MKIEDAIIKIGDTAYHIVDVSQLEEIKTIRADYAVKHEKDY